MFLVVGLGNPGKQYEKTVHNVGFMVVDRLLDKLGVKAKDKGCDAVCATTFCKGNKVIIAKPQTYMNLSGESVKQLVKYNGMEASDVIVVYDDIDLPLGAIRIRKEGSAGTHNGMKNVIANLGTTEVARIRVGVGDDRGKMQLKDYVLSNVCGEKKEKLDKVIDRVSQCLQDYIQDGDIEAVMRRYNGVINFD